MSDTSENISENLPNEINDESLPDFSEHISFESIEETQPEESPPRHVVERFIDKFVSGRHHKDGNRLKYYNKNRKLKITTHNQQASVVFNYI